jgi:hypothetical protein
VLRHAVARASAQLIEGPPLLRHPDHGYVEVTAACHRLQRGEDLLVREVPGRAEEDEGVGTRGRHRLLLEMAAELEAHGGEQAVLELRLAARAEAFEERGGEDVRRHALVDRGVERPSPLAGIGDPAGEALEARITRQGGGGEVEEPRRDDAAAAPHLGDVGEV